ncbi:hypothetical protein ACFLIM_19350 [Nonomuraea sp. M3C6]|uniref:Secreted protein n=1 Tax=Nonomuraea marmarensis TaxID=3351344 RepID=A0ABW7ADB9_9ACTN
MITSAVVAVVAVLAALAVAKTRRRARLAAAAYMAPSPSMPVPRHSTAEPDEGNLWRWELLEAIEAAAALPLDTIAPSEQDSDPPDTPAPSEQDSDPPDAPAPTEQVNRRSEPSPSGPDSGLGPQEEPAAWTEPFEVVIHTGPLESIVDTGPLERIVIPAATSPFDAFAPADTADGSIPDPTYHGRRRRSEHPAGDEGVAADAPAERTPSSGPGASGGV